jgi:flavin reductase (DIM6/NTAB) family NADH-FMN oxidoreductase RutF
MAKKEMGAVACIYSPAVIVGVKGKGKIYYTLFKNCGIVSVSPATVYISSDKKNFVNSLIKKAKTFSVNLPSASLAAAADYCADTDKKTDKSTVFTAFFGAETGVPMAEECPINIECKLKKTLKIDETEIFIGEVINSLVGDECLTGGKPDVEKVMPLFYDIAANRYRTVGKWTVEADKIGKDYKKQAEKRAEKEARDAKEAKSAEKKAAKDAKKAEKKAAKKAVKAENKLNRIKEA